MTDSVLSDRFHEPLNGRYQIQRQLGKRVGRQTLLALDLQTQDQVVIKLLSLGQGFQWQDLKLFEREAKTLQALTHPAIPCYIDYFDVQLPHHKGFALVQSYVAARSLEEQLKAGRTFSEAEVKELAEALLKILSYLHEQSPAVVHRDIKPSNILLGDRSGNSVGQVYLVDFGSVQTIAAQEGGTITVVGTYGYMPPEQFGGRATPASDLYSLGATLIFLVTGRHPTELPQADFRIQFQSIVRLSPAFADWLEWMTEPSLDRRLASAQTALQALEQPRRRKKTSILQRPVDTNIVLTKSAESLEIALPPRGLGLEFVGLLSLVTPLLLFWLPVWVMNGPVSLYVWVTALVAVLILLGLAALSTLFQHVRLRIDSRSIALTNQFFGLQWNRLSPARRQDICELESTPRHLKNHPKGGQVWVESNLTIWAGDRRFDLNKGGRLTEEEVLWLGEELSDWLGLSRKS